MNLIVLSIPVFFILIGLEVIYDRVKNRHLYRLNDAVSNISCGIFEQTTGVFAKVFTVEMYAFVYEQWRFFTVPDTWYSFVLLFLAVDFAYYWAHRKSHEINLLWIGHVVHHQSEEYNLSVALRQGALQKIFTSFFYLPIALLGFSPEFFLLIAAINTLYQFWIHTEAIGRLGPLEWVMNTPSHHRVHHGRNPNYIDRNHAGVFIIWDRMFGTFQPEEEHPVYGITTPVHTWDAVTAHVRPFQNLAHDWKLIREWKYKLQLLFKKPGWLPQKYGGYREPIEVNPESYQKFDTGISIAMNWYLLIHFLFILTGTTFFLFGFSKMSGPEQILFAAIISLSIMTTGFLFEGKRWATGLEIVRLVITAVMLVLYFRHESFKVGLLIFIVVILAFSIAWLFRFSGSKKKHEQ
jgi:sterol desaturase/sphingolipid hydroxylase (fatty acid hydroxylase superfamily)